MKTCICAPLLLFIGVGIATAQAPSTITSPIQKDLTPEQLSAIVTISGKAGSGTGFFCSLNGKVYVLTNQHVLAGNADATFRTQSGVSLRMEAIYGADSADLALLVPKSIPADVVPFDLLERPEMNARKDDPVLIPGNSKGDGVVTQTPGKIVAIGPQRIETDNPVYPGNSGSPLVHLQSGKVIGVLTEAELISLNEFEKASFRSKQSAIKSEIRYFAHRADTVSKWIPMNWNYFQETDHLVAQSRDELDCLLAYLTDSSEKYKTFKELHEASNRAAAVWRSGSHSPADKFDALRRFIRDIDGLTRRAQRRLENRQFSYIHRQQVRDIEMLVEYLRGNLDIANRDTDLVVLLVQRGNWR
jgi:hypothetical protein